MGKWNCKNCDFNTDNFNDVWNHAKGMSHKVGMK